MLDFNRCSVIIEGKSDVFLWERTHFCQKSTPGGFSPQSSRPVRLALGIDAILSENCHCQILSKSVMLYGFIVKCYNNPLKKRQTRRKKTNIHWQEVYWKSVDPREKVCVWLASYRLCVWGASEELAFMTVCERFASCRCVCVNWRCVRMEEEEHPVLLRRVCDRQSDVSGLLGNDSVGDSEFPIDNCVCVCVCLLSPSILKSSPCSHLIQASWYALVTMGNVPVNDCVCVCVSADVCPQSLQYTQGRKLARVVFVFCFFPSSFSAALINSVQSMSLRFLEYDEYENVECLLLELSLLWSCCVCINSLQSSGQHCKITERPSKVEGCQIHAC